MSKKTNPVLCRVLALALTLFLLLGCNGRVCEDWRVIVDNSGSLRYALPYLGQVCETVSDHFAKKAQSGSGLTMIGFAAKDQPYKHRVCYSCDLQIEAPAWQYRNERAKQIGQELSAAVATLPLVETSPLLEVLNFQSGLINESKSRIWRLVWATDCMQCSSNLNLTPAYLKTHTDEQIIKAMLKICPPPKCPPVSIIVYWYPGLYDKKKAIDPLLHERIRELFRQFFCLWAGNACETEFIAIKEV